MMEKKYRRLKSFFFGAERKAFPLRRRRGTAGRVKLNAYYIDGDFRPGRWRQLRVMDRSGSQLLIRLRIVSALNLFLVVANVMCDVQPRFYKVKCYIVPAAASSRT